MLACLIHAQAQAKVLAYRLKSLTITFVGAWEWIIVRLESCKFFFTLTIILYSLIFDNFLRKRNVSLVAFFRCSCTTRRWSRSRGARRVRGNSRCWWWSRGIRGWGRSSCCRGCFPGFPLFFLLLSDLSISDMLVFLKNIFKLRMETF